MPAALLLYLSKKAAKAQSNPHVCARFTEMAARSRREGSNLWSSLEGCA